MRVLFAGGGTGGHINPALAIAKYVLKKEPDSKILFVGTKHGMETRLVPEAGFELRYIDVQGFRRSLSVKNIAAAAKAFHACLESQKIIKQFQPDIAVGTGGYVSGPVLAAAARLKIPTLIHEQNVFAGMTSKMLSSMVDTVCISFEESRCKFPKAKKIVHTGNPIREELFAPSKRDARTLLDINKPYFIAAFGGSLGAERFNQAVVDFISHTKQYANYQLLLGTGEGQYQQVLNLCQSKGISLKAMPHITITPYIHNMGQVMAAADLVIARAGAITISELNALGKPSILIPSPNVTDNHQEYNARTLEKAGAALVFTEQQLTDTTLMKAVVPLLENKTRLEQMARCSLNLGIRDGTQRIYREMKQLIQK
jgi:UDP-N-acetylglucosamine--N-acetylmuramyl-(pentapeptide) pyrophosphoryl-undecaprenol N-acetylglucosamine transferase